MTRHSARKAHILSVVALVVAIVMILAAPTSLSQVWNAGLASGESSVVSAPPGASAPAQAERPLTPWTDGAGPFSAGRSQTKRHGPVPMDSNPPLFLPAVAYDSGGIRATSVAVADVNGDGKPDLVVANWCASSSDCNGNNWGFDGSVAVLLGNGDGTFQPAVAYASGGATPVSVAAADVNGDGKPDIIVANTCASGILCPGGGSVGVLLGNGDGTFQPALTYDSGGTIAESVAVADFNGDGKPDLAVANWYGTDGSCCWSPALGVLLGNGDGTFQPAVSYSWGGQTSVAAVDVNGDHRPDLVVANALGYVEILLGNGDGTFQRPVTYSTGGSYPDSVATADLNGDGKLDLVVANGDLDNIVVLLGNGDGTFKPAVAYGSGGSQPWSVALADVNGDGKPDILAANAYSSTVGVLLGNGDGTFQAALTYGSGGSLAMSVVAADVNGDGTPDLVAGNVRGSNLDGAVGVLLNNTKPGKPTTTTVASSPNPSVFGQAVTLTAAVSSASGTPVGTVVFFDGSTALGSATLASGSASISISSLSAGSHSITAAYQGSGGFGPSTSSPLNQVVNPATTTTSLVSSANPARVRQSVTYTATVTSQCGGAATGTVTFQDGGATIATVALSGNQAAYRTSYPVAGIHSITATYSSDANNGGSMSSALTEEIGKVHFPSETTLATSGSPSFVGQPVTFTATVTSIYGAIPDGELVTFYDGSPEIGTGTTARGVATFTTSSLTGKTHFIKATYAGDATFAPSTGSVKQVVDKDPTTTALVSSLNPSTYGQAVTFTATITSTGPNTPTGSVKFGGLGYAPLSGGVAALTKTWLNAGTYAITAEYEGDSASAPSTSSVLNQVVNPASTTTAITSSANPSSPGETVTFTATVTSSTGAHATGTVTFTAGATTLGTVALNGVIASISTATLPVGSTIITATYNGATDFTGSSASLTQKNEARKSDPQSGECWTTTTLSSSGSPSLVTDGVTFTADVNLSTYCRGEQTGCDGRVVFYDRRAVIGTATVNSKCVATIGVSLTIGSHRIEAAFQPPSHWYPSYAHLTQVVNGFPTFTTLGSSQNPSIHGQDVTIVATVGSDLGGPAPTGKMKFVDGANTIGYVTLDNNGVATFTRKFLPVGTNPITAEYFGDSLYAPSTSPVLNQLVNPDSTTTVITSSANPSSSGQSVTFTATVRSTTGVLPTGTVTFTAGTTTLGTVALDGKHASVSTAALPVGSTIITATYNGATDFTGSSAALTQTVQP